MCFAERADSVRDGIHVPVPWLHGTNAMQVGGPMASEPVTRAWACNDCRALLHAECITGEPDADGIHGCARRVVIGVDGCTPLVPRGAEFRIAAGMVEHVGMSTYAEALSDARFALATSLRDLAGRMGGQG